MQLKNESQTLFIPLYGKAIMSKKKLFLNDRKAEEIVSKVDYNFDKLKQSKWLSMYMSLRANILDELVNRYLKTHHNTIIIHLGCGLDSRCLRVNQKYDIWYDIDFENVIQLRKQFYQEDNKYKMISSSISDLSWLDKIIVKDNVLVVAEGLLMYLSEKEIEIIINGINNKFKNVSLLFDTYTKKAVRMSKYKNPINQMNAIVKFGMDNEEDLIKINLNLKYVKKHIIKNKESNLKGLTKYIFEHLYCGKISQSLYMIYEFNLIK